MSKTKWPEKAKILVNELHLQLSLSEKDWHKLKGNSDRRAAELLSASLSQLINNGKREDVLAMIDQGLLWIKREIKDPGCPNNN